MLVLGAGAGPHSLPEFNNKHPVMPNRPAHHILTCGFVNTQALSEILHQKFSDADIEERQHAYLKPFRILLSLLDKPEIGTVGEATAARCGGRYVSCVLGSLSAHVVSRLETGEHIEVQAPVLVCVPAECLYFSQDCSFPCHSRL